MSAVLAPAAPAAAGTRPLKVTQGRGLRSEWTKFHSLRSTRWSLLVGIFLTIAFPILFAAITSARWGHMSLHERASRHPLDIALAGVNVAQLAIAVLGVLVMRAAGCVINDYADRNFDPQVRRTRERPLAAGRVTAREAMGLFTALCVIAFALVLLTNRVHPCAAPINIQRIRGQFHRLAISRMGSGL